MKRDKEAEVEAEVELLVVALHNRAVRREREKTEVWHGIQRFHPRIEDHHTKEWQYTSYGLRSTYVRM